MMPLVDDPSPRLIGVRDAKDMAPRTKLSAP